jgi:cytidine deaminase
VGAVVTDSEGNLITIGCNEVPKSGGGLYWPDPYDRRDFQLGYESGARIKNEIVAEVISRLKQARWLSKDKQAKEVSELVEQIMDPANRELMKGAQILDLLEFGRMVHAEMAAISDAAARGLALTDATMYVTTFPCHMCARYRCFGCATRCLCRAYPKSRAQELHDDSIVVDSENPGRAS